MDYPRFCPLRLAFDKDYATTPLTHPQLMPFYASRNYYRPWCNQSATRNFGSTVENSKEQYKITLDVQNFQHDEVSVKVNNKEIIIEGKHEERQDDHGFVSRQFKRRYALPDNCLPENIVSTLSSDGVLTVIAEKRSTKSDEKYVPIKVCGSCPKIAECRATRITQKDIDDAIREANELINRDKAKSIREDRSCLLKSDFTGDAISGKEKKSDDLLAGSSEKMEFAGSSKLQNTIGGTNVGMSETREELAQSSRAATSSMSALKSVSESVRQESSSYKSSMSSSLSSNEHISAKLREAAENI